MYSLAWWETLARTVEACSPKVLKSCQCQPSMPRQHLYLQSCVANRCMFCLPRWLRRMLNLFSSWYASWIHVCHDFSCQFGTPNSQIAPFFFGQESKLPLFWLQLYCSLERAVEMAGWVSHFETEGSFEDSVLTTADVFPIIAMDGWRIKNRMVKRSFRVHLIGLMEQYGAEATQTPDETTNSLDNTRHSQCQSHSILASLETSANHCCNVSRKPLRMAGIKMLDGPFSSEDASKEKGQPKNSTSKKVVVQASNLQWYTRIHTWSVDSHLFWMSEYATTPKKKKLQMSRNWSQGRCCSHRNLSWAQLQVPPSTNLEVPSRRKMDSQVPHCSHDKGHDEGPTV